MQHTKHTLQRHNGPVGWLVAVGVAWIIISGIVRHPSVSDYESDKVEQAQ